MRISAPKSIPELQQNCDKIAGKTVAEIARKYNLLVPTSTISAKGWLGQLIEYVLGADAASKPAPDFTQLGIELKTIPLTAAGKPKESTYVCAINQHNLVNLLWEKSLVRKKLNHVLWVPLIKDRDSIANTIVGTPIFWRLNLADEQVIKNDWQELMDMLSLGKLEEIHGAMGTYLQIRPKAANSRSRCKAFDANGKVTMTLPRGFYLRSSFTSKIMQNYYI